jgi:hypothetical protein
VLQHFYPYFDVVDVDWNEQLTIALTETLEVESEFEFWMLLKKLFVALQDGHGWVSHPVLGQSTGWFPIGVVWVENQVVAVSSDVSEIQPGDLIVDVDGIPAAQVLEEQEQYLPGSPQFKRIHATWKFGYGLRDSVATLTVLRDDDELQVNIGRTAGYILGEPRPQMITELLDGIWYVDLDRAGYLAIEPYLDTLAGATGVIFDLRGYTYDFGMISHLIDDTVLSPIFNLPHAIYPDREDLVEWDVATWSLSPREPRITGQVVFLTDASAVSAAETYMGIIEGYGLAEIVGRPTAGANGNINPFILPGQYTCYWTGMKVLKHDGSQHHLIGILPTVPVERTLEAVREGRDEDLETAIAIIQGGLEP